MSKVSEQENISIEDLIPIGIGNAISRKYLASITGLNDRIIRRLISESPAPIVNLGYGYFIPDINDSVDISEARSYVAQEQTRIRTLEEKLNTKFAGIA